MLHPIAVGELPAEWPTMARILAPALQRAGKAGTDLFKDLMAREATAFRLSGPAHGYVVASTGSIRGTKRKALWVWFAAGGMDGGPKQRLRTARRILAILEGAAREAKAHELRVEARNAWRHVLDGYGVLQTDNKHTIFAKVL